MDIFEHEERLLEAGFKAAQARELVRLVQANDTRAMTKADGEQLTQSLRQEFKGRFEAIDGRFQAIEAKMAALQSNLTATIWTVGGVMIAVTVGLDRLLG